MKRFLDRLVSDRLVMAVIIFNAAALVLSEMSIPGSRSAALWFWVDYACGWFVLAEVLINSKRGGWAAYWASGWNRFDFTVVMLSISAVLLRCRHRSQRPRRSDAPARCGSLAAGCG